MSYNPPAPDHHLNARRSTLPDSPTSGLAAGSSLATAPMSTSRCIAAAPRRPMSRKARAASGNACTTTGPIPTTSSSRRPTPTRGEARPATLTTSHVVPTARPTLTWSSCARARTSRDGCSAWSSGPSARAFWKRRLKTRSRLSKPGTARLERHAHREPSTDSEDSLASSLSPPGTSYSQT